MLGLFGDDDPSIPVANVRAFEDAMRGLGKAVEIVVYPQVGHAFEFADANGPASRPYRPEIAAAAWSRSVEFLAAHLKD